MRRAERLAAAQSELIGIAQADLYPAFSINGTLGWQSQNFTNLFAPGSLNGNVGPSFQWNLLNYGRIANNVRLQDAKFRELVVTYQQTVLQAAEEAEDGLVTFLQAQERTRHLEKSVSAASAAVKDMFLPTAIGQPGFDFNRFALIEQNRVTQQDLLAQSRGQIAQGLIQTYRALGGGWEIRQAAAAGIAAAARRPAERRAGRGGGAAEVAEPAGAAGQPARTGDRATSNPTAGHTEAVRRCEPVGEERGGGDCRQVTSKHRDRFHHGNLLRAAFRLGHDTAIRPGRGH